MDSDTAIVSAGDAHLVKEPNENAKSLKITALNDDCLLALFSHLSVEDLGAMKQSPPRFAWAANDSFKKKHGLDKGRFYNFPWVLSLDKAAKLLHNFGCVIPRVTFLAIQEKQAYFSLLKDCSAIETLVIIDRIIDLIPDNPMELSIFQKLKVLCLSKSSGTDADYIRILNACDTSYSTRTLQRIVRQCFEIYCWTIDKHQIDKNSFRCLHRFDSWKLIKSGELTRVFLLWLYLQANRVDCSYSVFFGFDYIIKNGKSDGWIWWDSRWKHCRRNQQSLRFGTASF